MAVDVDDREIRPRELHRLAALHRPTARERALLSADLAVLGTVAYYVTPEGETARLPDRQRAFVQTELGRLVELRDGGLGAALRAAGLGADPVLYHSAIPACWPLGWATDE